MARPKPLPGVDAPGYPTLAEHTSSRRTFLTRVAFGSLAAGLGGTLLIDCMPDDGGMAIPDYFPLRFPTEGTLPVELSDGGSVPFFVRTTTYERDVADHFTDVGAAQLDSLVEVLAKLSSDDLADNEALKTAQDDVRNVLEALVLREFYHDDAAAQSFHFVSVELFVCDSGSLEHEDCRPATSWTETQ